MFYVLFDMQALIVGDDTYTFMLRIKDRTWFILVIYSKLYPNCLSFAESFSPPLLYEEFVCSLHYDHGGSISHEDALDARDQSSAESRNALSA